MTLEELAASWDDKAARWRRTAKQQRSACRTGDGAKVRLLEKAQLAEDCARELREVMAESAKRFGSGLRGLNPTLIVVDEIQQDKPALKAKVNRRIGRVSADLESKIKKVECEIAVAGDRLAAELEREARESTVDDDATGILVPVDANPVDLDGCDPALFPVGAPQIRKDDNSAG